LAGAWIIGGGKLYTGFAAQAATRMGGIAAGAEGEQLDHLTRYGAAIGLAFQMADDILDREEDAGLEGPPSYVKLLGEDETRLRAEVLLKEAIDAAQCLAQPDKLVALARFTVERDH